MPPDIIKNNIKENHGVDVVKLIKMAITKVCVKIKNDINIG
jgi:hypothetical protein